MMAASEKKSGGARSKQEIVAVGPPAPRPSLWFAVEQLVSRLPGHMHECFGDWPDREMSKRSANLASHLVTATEGRGGENPFDKIGDIPSATEWLDGASKVDPADAELSAIWQAALDALESNDLDRRRLLRIAKQLEPDEAAEFVRMMSQGTEDHRPTRLSDLTPRWIGLRSSDLPRREAARFRQLGLIETTWRSVIVFPTAVFAGLAIVGSASSYSTRISGMIDPRTLEAISAATWPLILFVGIISISVFGARLSQGMPFTVTPDGSNLWNLARRHIERY